MTCYYHYFLVTFCIIIIVFVIWVAGDVPCEDAPVVSGAYVASHSLTTLTASDGTITRTAIAVYACARGRLQGDGVIHCKNGHWLDRLPTCLVEKTIAPPSPPPQTVTALVPKRMPKLQTTSPRTPPPTKKSWLITPPKTTTTLRPVLHFGSLNSFTKPCKYHLPITHAMCVRPSPDFIEKGITSPAEILSRHNYWRATVSPPAFKPLSQLRWDPDLAEMAERWASQCSLEHTPSESRELPERGNKPPWPWVGQNIFIAWGFLPDWTYAIDHWADERKNWKYGVGLNGTGVIGHYTQIIWQDTRYIGCGRAVCQGMQHILLCNYGPGGNLGINGANPYAWPFQITEPDYENQQNSGSGIEKELIISGSSGSGSYSDDENENYHLLPLPRRGPQCKYGLPRSHAFCLDDSEFLVGFERSSQKEILNRIYYWRTRVSPPAKTPLSPMRWDPDLATSAERWAAQCKMGHDKPENRRLPYRGVKGPKWEWVGQNICYSWGYSMSWTECINNWAAERKDWEYGAGQVGNGMIGHYTQLIWADTRFVGCGKARCKSSTVEYVMVCNFGPGGNVAINGADPYSYPYEASIKPQ